MQKSLRILCKGILFAGVVTWLYFSYVRAPKREAILVENRYSDLDAKDVIHPAQMAFLPLRILPGYLSLHSVTLFPRSLQFYFKKGLEQSEMLGLDDTFYIRILLHLDYELDSKKLIPLFQNLGQRDWKGLDSYLKLRVQKVLERRLVSLYKTDADLVKLKIVLQDYFSTQAIAELNQEFLQTGVRWRSLNPLYIFIPNAARYRSMLSISQKIIEQKIERIRTIDQAYARKDAAQIENQEYFIRLKKIGQLLATYPHLRDYLSIDRLGKNVRVMVMPYQRWFPPPATALEKAESRQENIKEDTGMSKHSTFPFSDLFSKESTGPSAPGDGLPSESIRQKESLYKSNIGRFADLSPP